MSVVSGRLCFLLLVLVACSVDALECYKGVFIGDEEAGVINFTEITCEMEYTKCGEIKGGIKVNGANANLVIKECIDEDCDTEEIARGVKNATSSPGLYIRSVECCKGDLCNDAHSWLTPVNRASTPVNGALPLSPPLPLTIPLLALLSFHF